MPEKKQDAKSDNFDDFDDFNEFDDALDTNEGGAPQAAFEASSKLDFYSSIPVEISLEVGSSTVPLSTLMSANSDTVIELNKLADEPLDIKVNGKLFGHGEVVMSNNRYSLRILSILSNDHETSEG